MFLSQARIILSIITLIFLSAFAVWWFDADSSRCTLAMLPNPSENTTAEPPTSIENFYQSLRWYNPYACYVSADFGGTFYGIYPFIGLDGEKTICLDRGIGPIPYFCTVYSFGSNNDFSFDDAIAKYGCHVYTFDPSLQQDDHWHSEKVQFFRTGLGTKDTDKDERGWKIRKLTSIRNELVHHNGNIAVLKLDVEGDEWEILKQLVGDGLLATVKQLAVEVHIEIQESVEAYIDKYWNVLRSIELAGFVRFSSQVNPWAKKEIPGTDKMFFTCYEMVWYNAQYKH